MILYESFHTIDIDTGETRRKIPNDFAAFINEYVDYAAQNDSVKYYTIQNEHTTVVHCIDSLANNALAEDEPEEEVQYELDRLSQVIAEKLVHEEREAQERINGTGKRIKKGSLVQAFIETDDHEYLYIIAKVEHTEYFDGESLEKSFGFPSEKKNVWKSAVFPLNVDQGISFDTVRIYTDNEAKYWAREFLELDEEHNDTYNTKIAFTAINQELKRRVQKISERDYWLLNNSVYQKMRTPHHVNYPEMITAMLDGYVPDNEDVNTEELRMVLLGLPEKKNFDSQFAAVPAALSRKNNKKYILTDDVELRITGSPEDDAIVSFTDEQGRRFLKVKCDDDKTYNTFLRRES